MIGKTNTKKGRRGGRGKEGEDTKEGRKKRSIGEAESSKKFGRSQHLSSESISVNKKEGKQGKEGKQRNREGRKKRGIGEEICLVSTPKYSHSLKAVSTRERGVKKGLKRKKGSKEEGEGGGGNNREGSVPRCKNHPCLAQ